jgi:hypothetical protein
MNMISFIRELYDGDIEAYYRKVRILSYTIERYRSDVGHALGPASEPLAAKTAIPALLSAAALAAVTVSGQPSSITTVRL